MARPSNRRPISALSVKRSVEAYFVENSMVQHDLLSKEDEQRLSRLYLKSKQLRNKLELLSENTDMLKDAAGLAETESNHPVTTVSAETLQTLQLKDANTVNYILLRGQKAREILILSNLKLVASLAKRWARSSSSEQPYSMYYGSWDRPALGEVMQEGILGLHTAVDRFDPSKNLRLSTYATFWITNSIRRCFQQHTTPTIRFPTRYYDARTRYKRLVKEYLEALGYLPELDVIAKDMGMSEPRLRTILKSTQSFMSIDQPMHPNSQWPGKSGDTDGDVRISDTLVDQELQSPEDIVELSLFRSSLESAMANELEPYERDVLRLRLGLDDGVARTRPQVSTFFDGLLSSREVRTLENKALTKLRSPLALETYQLISYLDYAGVDRETITMR